MGGTGGDRSRVGLAPNGRCERVPGARAKEALGNLKKAAIGLAYENDPGFNGAGVRLFGGSLFPLGGRASCQGDPRADFKVRRRASATGHRESSRRKKTRGRSIRDGDSGPKLSRPKPLIAASVTWDKEFVSR